MITLALSIGNIMRPGVKKTAGPSVDPASRPHHPLGATPDGDTPEGVQAQPL